MPSSRTSRAADARGSRARAGVAFLVGAALAWCGCSSDGKREGPVQPVNDPREAALVLLQAAQTGRTSRQDLAGIFGDLESQEWARIGDALRPLKTSTGARITSAEELRSDRFAVDLEVALPGGGGARYRVQTARRPDGTWRVISLDGPGVAWPPGGAPRDEGLTTSAPPHG